MSKIIFCIEVVSTIVTLLCFVVFMNWAINGPVTPGEYGVDDKLYGCLFWGASFTIGLVLTISLQYLRKRLYLQKQ